MVEPMYKVSWTENEKKRELKFYIKKTAQVMLNRLILDCGYWDAKLTKVRGVKNGKLSYRNIKPIGRIA